jgi:carbon storage regulator
MLVLSRKVGERIVLGGRVVVTVVAMRGSRIVLGVEAPPDVSVWREEIIGTECETTAAPSRGSRV